jgi:hypothetical protein
MAGCRVDSPSSRRPVIISRIRDMAGCPERASSRWQLASSML